MIPILFADIEAPLADRMGTDLLAQGDTAPVVIGVPDPRPSRFVRLVRVGGSQSNLVTDRPRIVFECWSTVGVDAAALAALVRALVNALAPGYVGAVWVDRVIDIGVAYSPDPQTGTPRYLVTAELHVRGAALA
jgi:hypothetical protein